ncbi:MAG: outer membrane beta-barrel protein [Chitinophagaceae bacterium]
MEGKNHDREFEQFLKENADNHRLYPSDEIWNKIHARLHPNKRWPLTALLLLAFTTGSITWLANSERTTASPESAIATVITPNVSTPSKNEIFTRSIAVETTVNTFTGSEIVSNINLPLSSIESSKSQAISQVNLESPASTAAITKPENTTEVVTTLSENEEAASIELSTTQPDVEEKLPLTIESVTNSYQRQKHNPRFNWQLHFTPTISYRSLQEDQKFIAQARMNLSAAPSYTPELNNVITHRPDLGMQVGITGTYPLGKRIDLVAGLQFNVSKYDIKAFNYPSEVATIALMNSWGGSTAVSTLTSFRSNGFMAKASWLRNYYYSLSVPLGLEWRILGKKQNHWGFSTTIQPTYVVGNRSYMISMDYQNYAEVPYLINKWNMNVGFETYAKFSIGKNDFRIGPQVRYQLFSSFKKGYPVSEHLYDFGVKLGMQLGK